MIRRATFTPDTIGPIRDEMCAWLESLGYDPETVVRVVYRWPVVVIHRVAKRNGRYLFADGDVVGVPVEYRLAWRLPFRVPDIVRRTSAA